MGEGEGGRGFYYFLNNHLVHTVKEWQTMMPETTVYLNGIMQWLTHPSFILSSLYLRVNLEI